MARLKDQAARLREENLIVSLLPRKAFRYICFPVAVSGQANPALVELDMRGAAEEDDD